MRGLRLVGLTRLLLAVGLLLLVATPAATAAGPTIREFSDGLTAGAQPNGIARGPDGAMWFTERGVDKIGRIAPDGTITEIQLTAGALPAGIVAGPDGNVWFTEYGTNMVGDINPSTRQLVGEYPVGDGLRPEGIAVGSDGNLWVTLNSDRAVMRVIPNQTVPGTSDGLTPYVLTNSDSGPQPTEITSGPDGKLWVTAGSTLWSVDPENPPTGNAPAFDLSGNPSSNTNDAEGITVGPDGKLWAALFVGGQIAQIDQSTITSANTTTGRTYFATGGMPLWVSNAGDHALWITDRANGGQLIRFDPVTQTTTTFGAAQGVSGDPNVDAQDSSGNLWFTEFNADKIGEVVFALVNTARPAVTGVASPDEVLSCSTGSWAPAADMFQYEWLRDGTPIAGATESQYKLPADANGHSFSCRVTATSSSANVSGTATSASVGAAPLKNVTLPTITGALQDGGQVTCQPGTWSPSDVTFAYDWFWNARPPLSSLQLKLHQKAFGVKPTSKLFGAFLNPPLFGGFSPLAQTRSIFVPHLAAPTSLYCTVIATAGSGETAQASSATVIINPPAPMLVRNPRTFKFERPYINPRVGVPGTNVCVPGRWSGNPTFSYAWYLITADRKTVSGKRYTLLGRQQAYKIAPADERHTIDCWVTAKNKYGSPTERSNSYVVPLGAPSPTGDLQVSEMTLEPSSRGVLGSAGGDVVAEQIDLKCLGDNWNRPDVKVSYQWTTPTWSFDGSVQPQAGQLLTFDMRPGHLQYQLMTVVCQATATTSHGVSSTERSGPIRITNGCREDYTLDDLNYYTINVFGDKFHYTYPWLDAVPPDNSGAVTGPFNFRGDPIPRHHVPRRAVTYGPNCLDYQKYLLGQGFDVKQFDQNDVNWVNH
jgi:streptogramin lyase